MSKATFQRFSEVILYSDANRAAAKPNKSLSEQVEDVLADLRYEREVGEPSNLTQAIDALSLQDFRDLCVLCLFGRDYPATLGTPEAYLKICTQTAVTEPRDDQSGYLEGKPIGDYLRRAERLLSGMPVED